MIFNLYAYEDTIQMPNILHEENKSYKLGIIKAGAVLQDSLTL